jgi:hypothetical protein
MKMPVYIKAVAYKCIGEVEVESKDDFEDAADELWKEKGYDSPSLCHQCAKGMEIGDWEIDPTEEA